MASYVLLPDFLLYAAPEGGADELDDHIIEGLLEAVSRYINNDTRRRFYASTETHYFDVPHGRELWLGDDLLSVTTLTNGNGAVIAPSEYKLKPYDGAPYYMLTLREASGVAWQSDSDGDTEGVISLLGAWGYSSAAPDDIKQACMMIARNIYRGRSGETAGAATVTAAGVVITPRDVPPLAADILAKYRRLV